MSTGIALKSLGHNVTILERNPTALLHDQGAGIVAGGDTLAFFKRYVRSDRPLAVTSYKRQYLNKNGDVVHTEEMVQNMTSVGDGPLARERSWEISRAKCLMGQRHQWDLAYHLLRASFDYTESDYCAVPAPLPGEGNAVHLHDHKVTRLDQEGDKIAVQWQSSTGQAGTIQADFVIGADGPSSTVRALVEPTVERTYTGYCALRGTVPESDVSPAARAAFCERFTFFHAPGLQILAYLIPGPHGAVAPGKRLVNFVYYTNFPAGSRAWADIMTDQRGARHHTTMPPGMMAPATWARQKRIAQAALPPPFAELVCATAQPFVQAVTDVLAPTNEYCGGRVLLVGDALAGFRPHTVASTSQACLDAMLLADYVAGAIPRAEWKRETMGFARYIQRRGVEMGNRSQFEDLPLEAHIHDRNVASTPREQEVYPDWATEI